MTRKHICVKAPWVTRACQADGGDGTLRGEVGWCGNVGPGGLVSRRKI
jgi:hypothetical protein